MSTCLLLALDAADDGGPACLQQFDGRTVLDRLLGQLPTDANVRIVTRVPWVAGIQPHAPGVTVRGVSGTESLLAAIVDSPQGRLAVIPAETVTNDLALQRMTDHAAGGTALLTATVGQPNTDVATQPAAAVRGRVVALGSPIHAVAQPTLEALGCWSVATGDRVTLHACAERVAALVGDDPLPGLDPLSLAVELLPVAIVRAGTAVRVTALPPGLVWLRTRTAGDLANARVALAVVDEERVRMDVAVKAEDGFFTTFFVSTYSRYLARAAARVGMTPDQVTVLSMLLGLVAAAGFAGGNKATALVGAIALQAAFTLDCVDGQLARYTRNFSTFGAWLDSIFDRGKEYVVYAGLAIGGLRAGDGDGLWLLAAALLTLQTFRHTVDLGYAEQQRRDVDVEVRRPLDEDVLPAAASHWQVTALPERSGLAPRIIGLLRSAEAVPGLKWLKRIVVLPIGERFALISILAVASGPRLVFTVLLGWGAAAAAYTIGGRAVRSVV